MEGADTEESGTRNSLRIDVSPFICIHRLNTTVLKHICLLGKSKEDLRLMSDHQHSPALFQKTCKHCKETVYTGSVKPDSRLVQDNELGLHCKHPGKGHASLLPARKTLGIEGADRLRI